MAEITFENPEAQEKKTWGAERIVRLVLSVFLFLALLGLFGSGGLVNTPFKNDGNLTVRTDRFSGQNAPGILEIQLPGNQTQASTEVAIEKKLLNGSQVETITPQAQFSRSDDKNLYYSFQTSPGVDTSIKFYLQNKNPGFTNGLVGVTNGPNIYVWRLIYP